MRVVVPFTKLHPATVWALAEYQYTLPGSPEIEMVDLGKDQVHGYRELLRRLWREGETFCLIEHDIEIGPSTLYDFRACQHGYCAAPYPWMTAIGPALGATRFRDSFIAKHPDAAKAVGQAHAAQLDVVFMRRVLARDLGEQPHVHAPVIHHNPAKALLPNAYPSPMTFVPTDDIGNLR